jgi:hypothetical protein
MPNEKGEKTTEELAEELMKEVESSEDKKEDKKEEDKKEDKKEEDKKDINSLNTAVEKLNSLLNPQMTQEQKEAKIKELEETSGLSRTQLSFINSAIQSTAIQTNLGVYQELGKSKAEKVLGDISPQLIGKVEEEMKKLAPEVQANPKAWEEMAFLVKGKNIDIIVRHNSTNKEDTKVNSGLTNPGRGSDSKKTVSKQYSSDEQQIINRYFGGKPEDYEKSKSSKVVGVVSKQNSDSSGNRADKELARLMGDGAY